MMKKPSQGFCVKLMTPLQSYKSCHLKLQPPRQNFVPPHRNRKSSSKELSAERYYKIAPFSLLGSRTTVRNIKEISQSLVQRDAAGDKSAIEVSDFEVDVKIVLLSDVGRRIVPSDGREISCVFIQRTREDSNVRIWTDLKQFGCKFPNYKDPWGQGSQLGRSIVMVMGLGVVTGMNMAIEEKMEAIGAELVLGIEEDGSFDWRKKESNEWMRGKTTLWRRQNSITQSG